jgi:hypothetical protein
VAGHVQPARHQGHGVEGEAAADLQGEADDADRRDQPRALFIAQMVGAQIGAIVSEGVERRGVIL